MNLAILIGVTEYAAPVSRLPACQNDLALMSKLIKQTKKFGDILELGADTSSATVKTQLAQFVTKHEGTVDELFFIIQGMATYTRMTSTSCSQTFRTNGAIKHP